MALQMSMSLTPVPDEGGKSATARSRSTSAGSGAPSSTQDSNGSPDYKATTLVAPPGLPGFDDKFQRPLSLDSLIEDSEVKQRLFNNFGAPPGLEYATPDAAAVSLAQLATAAAEDVLGCDKASFEAQPAADTLLEMPSRMKFPPPPPLHPPAFGAKVKVSLSSAQPPVQAPDLGARVTLAVSPPPAQPPVFGAKPSLPPPPPPQAPGFMASAQLLPPQHDVSLAPPLFNARMPVLAVPPPPLQAPFFLGAQMQQLAVSLPPAQAPVLGAQMQWSFLAPPPAQMPFFGASAVSAPPTAAPLFDFVDGSVAPPPSHAPLLHLADAFPVAVGASDSSPTVGSEGHSLGLCRPCAFLYTKGCANGARCAYCHLCKPGEKKRRMKDKRQTMRETNA